MEWLFTETETQKEAKMVWHKLVAGALSVGIGLVFVVGCSPKRPSSTDVSVTSGGVATRAAKGNSVQAVQMIVDPTNVMPGHFLGLGTEWDSASYDAHSVTDSDFAVVLKRLTWMRPSFLRIMMQVKWAFPDGRRFTPDNPAMSAFYRHLDYCQKHGITVFLTDWGCEPDWLRVPGVENVGDPKYAEMIGVYLDYLLRQRGYSCIRYFIMVNEPNLEVRDWSRWKQGLLQVKEQIQARGLDRQIALAGPDSSGADEWLEQAASELAGDLAVYDIHHYAGREDVRAGHEETYYRTRWDSVRQSDPQASGKVLLAGEAGLWSDGASGQDNPLHMQYEYGVDMADYAIQALSAGCHGVSAWMLDDNSHMSFSWGMWSDKTKGMTFKPWFYSWALMTRLLPAGAMLMPIRSPLPGLRGLAAKMPSDATHGAAWTFALVNRSNEPISVHLRVVDAGKVGLRTYRYCREERKADNDGFPLPVSQAAVNLSEGASVDVPAEGAIWMTSGREDLSLADDIRMKHYKIDVQERVASGSPEMKH